MTDDEIEEEFIKAQIIRALADNSGYNQTLQENE